MSSQERMFWFKGDPFINRYRLEGELMATTPIHIGTGETRDDTDLALSSADSEQKESHEISEIARDFSGNPYVPGSTLRGVIRNYLLQIFRSIDKTIANDEDLSTSKYSGWKQSQKIEYMKKASLLEQVFGTPFSESKIEFWDAPAITRIKAPDFVSRGWDEERQCYIVRSVSIDPITGTAEKHKLYSFEVVPPGMRYQVNIVGQNLDDLELGFLLFGINGFNSPVYPSTIGAMSGRGFGKMNFTLKNIYFIQSSGLEHWAKEVLVKGHAGYSSLPLAKNPNELIKKFKDAFNEKMKRSS